MSAGGGDVLTLVGVKPLDCFKQIFLHVYASYMEVKVIVSNTFLTTPSSTTGILHFCTNVLLGAC